MTNVARLVAVGGILGFTLVYTHQQSLKRVSHKSRLYRPGEY